MACESKEVCDKFDAFVQNRQLEGGHGGHSPKVKRERVEDRDKPLAPAEEVQAATASEPEKIEEPKAAAFEPDKIEESKAAASEPEKI